MELNSDDAISPDEEEDNLNLNLNNNNINNDKQNSKIMNLIYSNQKIMK